MMFKYNRSTFKFSGMFLRSGSLTENTAGRTKPKKTRLASRNQLVKKPFHEPTFEELRSGENHEGDSDGPIISVDYPTLAADGASGRANGTDALCDALQEAYLLDSGNSVKNHLNESFKYPKPTRRQKSKSFATLFKKRRSSIRKMIKDRMTLKFDSPGSMEMMVLEPQPVASVGTMPKKRRSTMSKPVLQEMRPFVSRDIRRNRSKKVVARVLQPPQPAARGWRSFWTMFVEKAVICSGVLVFLWATVMILLMVAEVLEEGKKPRLKLK